MKKKNYGKVEKQRSETSSCIIDADIIMREI
jgi:hypothetical protein